MKKLYDAPVLELLSFCSLTAIGTTTGGDDEFEDVNNSYPWNDGELGWT